MAKLAIFIFFLCTDLASLIGNAKCGTIRIFLPLRFYVKSILVLLKSQKLSFSPFDRLWISIFFFFWHFQNSKSHNLKMEVFHPLKSAVIDFRMAGKLLNIHTLWNIHPQSKFPIRLLSGLYQCCQLLKLLKLEMLFNL